MVALMQGSTAMMLALLELRENGELKRALAGERAARQNEWMEAMGRERALRDELHKIRMEKLDVEGKSWKEQLRRGDYSGILESLRRDRHGSNTTMATKDGKTETEKTDGKTETDTTDAKRASTETTDKTTAAETGSEAEIAITKTTTIKLEGSGEQHTRAMVASVGEAKIEGMTQEEREP